MQYLLLFGAIASEVIGTLALRVAANGRSGFYAVVAVGYVVAFTMLWGSLRLGMPLGIAYGIWAAAGVALTAVASRFLFREPLTRRMLGGIGFIVVGVLLIEIGADTEIAEAAVIASGWRDSHSRPGRVGCVGKFQVKRIG